MDPAVIARCCCDTVPVLQKTDHLVAHVAGCELFHVLPPVARFQAVCFLAVRIDIRKLTSSVPAETDDPHRQADDLLEVVHPSDDTTYVVFVVVDPRRTVRRHITVVIGTEEQKVFGRSAVIHPLPDRVVLGSEFLFLFFDLPVDSFLFVFLKASDKVAGLLLGLPAVIPGFAFLFRCQTLVLFQLFAPAGFRVRFVGQRIVLRFPEALGLKTFRSGQVLFLHKLPEGDPVELCGIIVLYS